MYTYIVAYLFMYLQKMKVHNFISWLVLTGVLITDCSDAVPLSDFIPFGLNNGDIQLELEVNNRGASSDAIPISPRFPFFNETYDNIYVSLLYVLYVQDTYVHSYIVGT